MLARCHLISAFFAFLGLVLLGLDCQAEVSVPNIFSDHMVLQQGQQNKVWGRANAGEKVAVAIADQKHDAVADDQGDWEVMLDALEAGGPHELVISCPHSKTVITDVLVGEVWICSGQSNMEWSVNRINDPDLVKAAANHPQIRMINYPNKGVQAPIWTHKKSQWMVCSPETVGEFSAVGYFFGRQLQQTIDVPIGLINNSWGGSAAEAWIDRQLLADDPLFQGTLDIWKKREARYQELTSKSVPSDEEQAEIKKLKPLMEGNARPANIYNGVLKSHLGYGMKGVVWYQGESNANRSYQYRDLFPKLISFWRSEWNQGDFPFYWVQLADFMAEKDEPTESAWAELREAQTMTMDKLPNTGEAVIIDVGEGKDIHPRNKLTVGQRLARWALANQYGVDVAYRSPRFKSMEAKDRSLILTFEHLGEGWRTFDVREPVGFAIAGEDKKFVWANAKILKDKRVEVWGDGISKPVAVRYAWADNPRCNMFTSTGLPLTPFRTDSWPGVTVFNR